jgi:hypothetical protein
VRWLKVRGDLLPNMHLPHAAAADADADADAGMGFCVFNNIAVAAAHALEARGLSRVAIVDYDVHHGNGTQVRRCVSPFHGWSSGPASMTMHIGNSMGQCSTPCFRAHWQTCDCHCYVPLCLPHLSRCIFKMNYDMQGQHTMFSSGNGGTCDGWRIAHKDS